MKIVFLIRHAKSDRSISDIIDIDRPLNQRGYLDAHKMGAHLKKIIDGKILFVSSPAIRALTTALIFAREINYPQEKILINPELYETEAGTYKTIIKSIDDFYDAVLIFGHNPTITDVIGKLTGKNADDVPTCSVSVLKFETDFWSELKSEGEMEMQIFPKSLAE